MWHKIKVWKVLIMFLVDFLPNTNPNKYTTPNKYRHRHTNSIHILVYITNGKKMLSSTVKKCDIRLAAGLTDASQYADVRRGVRY